MASRLCPILFKRLPMRFLSISTIANSTQKSFCQKKLFTPGPLNTSMAVKEAMLRDLGSRDAEFLAVVKSIRKKLVEIAGGDSLMHTCIPIQGTGTYSVEAVFQCAIPKTEKRSVLILENGSYGKRMAKICQVIGIPYRLVSFGEDSRVDPVKVKQILKDGSDYCMVAVVHSETSSGAINPVDEIGDVIKNCGKNRPLFFIDAMSSFGAFPISLKTLPVDFIVSSANKCFEGVPGFSYVIARTEALLKCQGNARSLSLDIYDQWVGLEKTTQFRFTPPTHSMLAFSKALELFEKQGGVEGRRQKYNSNRQILREGMAKLGFREYLQPPALTDDSYIITSYHYPKDPAFNFSKLYQMLSDKGFVIYPGKVLDADSFRVGSIGDLTNKDFRDFLAAFDQVLKEMGVATPVKN